MVFPFSSSPFHKDPRTYATPAPAAQVKTAAEAQQQLKQFDYVIIGAGTAGSVLASRLSEDANADVLVIEAGGENTPLECKVPLTFGKLFHSKVDWDYMTVKQNEKLHNRELYWPRGKILGGSSSINAMMYQEGSATDYQEWEALGCEGYGPKELKAYHRRVENYTPNPKRPALEAEHRSSNAGGLLQTGHSWLSEITEKGFIEAAKEVGFPEVNDINTPNDLRGVVRFMTFISQKGERSSAATAYLPPSIQRRRNLTIALETRVTRVLFDTTGAKPRAIGVEVQNAPDAPLYQVAARKEVIVCGGAINAPQTLKLSGIGPADELRKHKIPVVVDNANVGAHLKDHLVTSPICVRVRPEVTLDYLTSDIKALPGLVRWLTTGTGPLTSNVGEVAAFFNTSDKAFPTTVPGITKPENIPENEGSMGKGPDIEIIATPLCYRDHGAIPAPPGHGVMSFVPIGLRPRSEGTIALASASVWDKPLIDPKYLSDEKDNDRKVLLAGLRVCLQILKADALKKYTVSVEPSDDINDFYWPYCAPDVDKITDDQLLEWMGKEAFTLYHPVSSCRMGKSPEDSVVDLEMRVHGVDGLRLCDASVFKNQVSGHPTSIVLALAEKCADIIKGQHVKADGGIKA